VESHQPELTGDAQFPARLTRMRMEHAYTQSDLSRLCGGNPSAQTISNWERGIRKPRTSVQRVALALRTTTGYLLWGEDPA
jgi:transcriptional regulator with XRE-family HTH domain